MYVNKQTLETVYRYRYTCLLSTLCIFITLSANVYIVHTTSIETTSIESTNIKGTNIESTNIDGTKGGVIFSPFSSTSLSESFSPHAMTSVPDMDANGITRHPRRIACGDKDSFGEGEDGEKLPEVTNREQKTPIGDIPIGFTVLLCALYIGYLSAQQWWHKKRDYLTKYSNHYR